MRRLRERRTAGIVGWGEGGCKCNGEGEKAEGGRQKKEGVMQRQVAAASQPEA